MVKPKQKMISPQEFAERIDRPYQTVMYWLRKGLVGGVEKTEESRGPVYAVPEAAVEQFKKQSPRRGRPPMPKKAISGKAIAAKK